MSNRYYTASERRGIIAVAFLALMITGSGLLVSFCGREGKEPVRPVVTSMSEMVDSTKNKINYKEDSNKKSSKKIEAKSKSNNKKKTYRRRRPLDETVKVKKSISVKWGSRF